MATKNGGDTLPFNKVEVEKALQDNPKALKQFNRYLWKKEYSKITGAYIAVPLLALGLVSGPFVLISGALVSVHHLAGISIYASHSLPMHYAAKRNFKRAIRFYNQ